MQNIESHVSGRSLGSRSRGTTSTLNSMSSDFADIDCGEDNISDAEEEAPDDEFARADVSQMKPRSKRVKDDEFAPESMVVGVASMTSMKNSMVDMDSLYQANASTHGRGSTAYFASENSSTTGSNSRGHRVSLPADDGRGNVPSWLRSTMEDSVIPYEHGDALFDYDTALRECLEVLINQIGECTARMRQVERQRSVAPGSSSARSGAEAATAFQQGSAGRSASKRSVPHSPRLGRSGSRGKVRTPQKTRS